MIDRIRALVQRPAFSNFIMAVIVFNAVLIGVETHEPLMASHGGLLQALNVVVLAIFVAEITLRLAAYWPRLGHFFRDGWNVFDFVIIAASLLPAAGPFATVARLARVLRILRTVSVSPGLRLIVSTMLRSIPSMGHVAMLLLLLLYVYAVIGLHLFRSHDPAHWGTLSAAMLSAFQMLTLEGWVEMQRAVIDAVPLAWIYFGSFIIVAVFVVVNLFIAVVLNNLESARLEEQAGQVTGDTRGELLAEIARLKLKLEEFEAVVREPTAKSADASAQLLNPAQRS